MNRPKPCYSLLAFFLFMLCAGTNLFGKTDQEMLEEHNKWLKILEITSPDTKPVHAGKYWDWGDKKNVISVYGKELGLVFDAETGELIFIFNDYLSAVKSKEHDAGKKVSFSLERATCEKTLAKYYKLITGEDPPEANRKFSFPSTGTLIDLENDDIGYTWPRTYEGYSFHSGDYIEIKLFPDDGTFKMYAKKYDHLPPSVEVKITSEAARQKAMEVANKEIRNWIHFLDSPSTAAAFLKMSGAPRSVRGSGKSKESALALENFASQKQESISLLSCTPEDVKPPYLEITNRNNTFNNNENRNYWDGKLEDRSPETRLSWVVTLRYFAKSNPLAEFEVWIDAKDGSLVGGYRPW